MIGHAPHNSTPTSIAAAESIAPHAPTLREQVFAFIKARGTEGATIDECATALSMRTATVCGRVDELKKDGRIVQSGATRKTGSGRAASVLIVPVVTDEMKGQRRDICRHIAKMERDGATQAELARAFPSIGPAALKQAIGAVWAYGLISDATGELRQEEPAWTVTKRGLVALGLEPREHWHVDQGEA